MTLSAFQSPSVLNTLLTSLPPGELEQLRASLVRVPLVRDQVLAQHGHAMDYAYFIESGVVSIVSEPTDGEDGIQVAMIGREGMIGDLSLMDMRYLASSHVVVHIPGTALRLPGNELRQVIGRSPPLRDACAHFAQSLMTQIMQTAVCNARRSLAERCARWLVMTLDRIEGNEVRVTHEALSAMLGIRRPGVTVAAAALQQAGLIRTGRGRVTVLDRERLHAVAQGACPVIPATPQRARADRMPHSPAVAAF